MAGKRFVITGTASTAGAVAGVENVAAALDKMAAKADKAKRASKGVAGGIEAMHGTTMAATGVLLGGAMAMDKIVMGGARYQALMQNLPFSIDAASKKTQGFISQTKLAENALLASRAGVAKTSAEYAELSEAVMKVAMSMGKDVNLAMTELTGALAKNETELLDNYGIILKVNQAQELYAKKLGKSKLTTEEAAEAFAKIGLDKIKEAASKATVELDDFTAGWLRLKTIITDVPRMVAAIRESIEESADAMDHFFDALPGTGMSLDRQTGLQSGIGRRRGGKGGLANAAKDVRNDALVDPGGTLKAWSDWEAMSRANSAALMDIASDSMKSAEKNLLEVWLGKRGKKGGSKKQFQWSAELRNQIRMAEGGRAMNRDAFGFEMALGAANGPANGPTAGNLGFERATDEQRREAFDKQLEQMTAVSDMEAEMVSVRRELQELDPWLNNEQMLTNIEAETSAKLRLLDTEEQYATEYLRGQERIQKIDRINADRKKAYHDAEVNRIRQERTVQKQRTVFIANMGMSAIDVFQQLGTAAAMAAFNGEKFGAKQVRDMAGQMAIQAALMGTFELVKAGIAAASFNFPAAAAHISAAGSAFAFAGVAGAAAGIAAGVAGGGGRGGGRGSGGGAPSRPGGSGFRGGEFNPVVPISRRGAGPSAPPPGSGAQGSSGSTTIIVQEGAFKSLAPTDADEFVFQLRKATNRSAGVRGRL